MKKSILSVLVVASSLVGLASCNGDKPTTSTTPAPTPTTSVNGGSTSTGPVAETARGEFHYNQYGSEYGCAVNVSIADGKITSIVKDDAYIAEKGYVELSESWNTDAAIAIKEAYEEETTKYFTSLVGKDAQSVYNTIAQGVSVAEKTVGEKKGIEVIVDPTLVIQAGATQTAARTHFAIANGIAAILKLDILGVTPETDPSPVDPTTTVVAA